MAGNTIERKEYDGGTVRWHVHDAQGYLIGTYRLRREARTAVAFCDRGHTVLFTDGTTSTQTHPGRCRLCMQREINA